MATKTARKIAGRDGHLVADTLSLILALVFHPAHVHDWEGASLVLEDLRGQFPQLKRIWADGGYAGEPMEWTKVQYRGVLEIAKRSDRSAGFALLPKR